MCINKRQFKVDTMKHVLHWSNAFLSTYNCTKNTVHKIKNNNIIKDTK